MTPFELFNALKFPDLSKFLPKSLASGKVLNLVFKESSELFVVFFVTS